MFATLKAEFRKMFSVRSTYILLGLAVLFTLFYAGYIEGYKLTGAELHNTGLLKDDIVGAITSLPILFGALVAILLVTHEYRYNTIMYTLTSSNSRTKVLVSKLVAISAMALVLTAVIGFLSPFASYWGVHLHGNTLAPQVIHYHTLVWRTLVSGVTTVLIPFILAVLIRNQVAAIVSLFVIPTVEQVLGLLLKNNMVYLPFSAQNSILGNPARGSITPVNAALVTAAYLVVGWIVSWVLFVRRDAN